MIKSKFKLLTFAFIATFSYTFLYSKSDYKNISNNVGNLINNVWDDISQVGKKPRAAIFCFVISSNRSVNSRGKSVYDTWGRDCDNFKFVVKLSENFTLKGIKDSDIIDPPDLTRDSYAFLTDKVYSTFKYLYKHYNNYDFYLKADDDVFVVMENLREFLSDKNSSIPASFGHYSPSVGGFNSGGAGYVLSNEALLRIGKKLTDDIKSCPNSGQEDTDTHGCLRDLGVYFNSTEDDEGRIRFHPTNFFADDSVWKVIYFI
jgi:glycoprotein-N-acetylgalactosamine 3-beta-galactosyltransferase